MSVASQMMSRLVLIALVLFVSGSGWARQSRDAIAEGNEAFASGKYEKALQLYEAASEDYPVEALFNRGTVLYRQGAYEEAVEDFRGAALKSEEEELAARAKYNLGNCAFRLAQKARKESPKEALAHCRESVRAYRSARNIDPDYREAAENIEIVRRYMQEILEELKQEEQEQKSESENQEDDLVARLKELRARQLGLQEDNDELLKRKSGEASSNQAAIKAELEDLQLQQRALWDDTSVVREELGERKSAAEQQAATGGQDDGAEEGNPAVPATEENPQEAAAAMVEKFAAAEAHVTDAMRNERGAAEQLGVGAQRTASRNQEEAAANLQRAIDALSDPGQDESEGQDGDEGDDKQSDENDEQDGEGEQNEEQDSEDGEQSEQEQSGDEGEEGENEQRERKEGDEQGEQEHSQGDDGNDDSEQDELSEGDQEAESESPDARESEESPEELKARLRKELIEDILNEAKKNQKRFRVKPVPGRPVDRDW